MTDVATYGQENDTVLGIKFLDGRTSAHGIAFAEDLLQIA